MGTDNHNLQTWHMVQNYDLGDRKLLSTARMAGGSGIRTFDFSWMSEASLHLSTYDRCPKPGIIDVNVHLTATDTGHFPRQLVGLLVCPLYMSSTQHKLASNALKRNANASFVPISLISTVLNASHFLLVNDVARFSSWETWPISNILRIKSDYWALHLFSCSHHAIIFEWQTYLSIYIVWWLNFDSE